MCHRFHRRGDQPSGQGSLTDGEFEQILSRVGFENILSPLEWLSRLKSNRLQNQNLCITFDDGLRSQYEVALPVLEKHGLQAFWFVYSSVFKGKLDKNEIYNYFAVKTFDTFDAFVDEFLLRCGPVLLEKLKGEEFLVYAESLKARAPFYTANDLKYRFIRNTLLSRNEFDKIVEDIIRKAGESLSELGENVYMTYAHLKTLHEKGHYVGLHSFDHPFRMADLPPEKQEDQFVRNYKHISTITGEAIEAMSHPLNSYNDDTLAILSKMGIVCGFRSTMIPPPGKNFNPTNLELAREDVVNLIKALT